MTEMTGPMFVPIAHIHPMLVHFPIVFFLTLAAFDVVAALTAREFAGRSIGGTIAASLAVLAGLSAVATWAFGHLALETAEAGGFHSPVAETHEALGGLTTIAFVAWAAVRGFLWWRDIRPTGRLKAALPAIEILGVLLVTATAYYGGQLVYGLGVNVARVATGG